MENKEIKLNELIKGLLQKLDFLLHDTEFYIYQYLKQVEWFNDKQELTEQEIADLDNKLCENFKNQHDLITNFLNKIKIDYNKLEQELKEIKITNEAIEGQNKLFDEEPKKEN